MIAWLIYQVRWWKWLLEGPSPWQKQGIGSAKLLKPVDHESLEIMTDRWLAREPKKHAHA